MNRSNRVTREGAVIQNGREIGRVFKVKGGWKIDGADQLFKRQSDAVVALIWADKVKP